MRRGARDLIAMVALCLATLTTQAQGQTPTVSVAITSPVSGQVINPPGNMTLTANASVNRGNWPILRVEYYDGRRLIGAASSPPYAVSWANVAPGSYTVIARAVATNPGQARQNPESHSNMPTWTAASAPVTIRVNALPAVTLTAPGAGLVGTAPVNVTISANAADTDGTIAKVDFYANGNPIGTRTQAPYTVNWTNAGPGTYSLNAIATDNDGAASMSGSVAVRVNAPPTVAVTAPASNGVYRQNSAVRLSATATDTDGSIARVDFRVNGTTVGTANAPPYVYDWSAPASGSYSVTMVATDNDGASVTSTPVAVRVNALPQVSLTAPAANTVVNSPGSFTVAATAADSDGAVTKVEFYANGALIGGATQGPYTVSWSDVGPGSYTLTAVATDADGGVTTSNAISVRVNRYPTVTLTAPAASAVFKPGAAITLTATAQDLDGAISRVEFYAGATLIATVVQAPYNYSWTGVAPGTHTLTARAVDDTGAGAVSVPITISVANPEAQIYFIHTDHLNTPRAITNQNREVVWSWANDDPFGNNPANEDPRNTGTSFTCNLRFPGQYFDKETNLHYNYFRDYSPSIGRYVQSDPIGLAAGPNTYLYVKASPLRYVDPRGLAGCGPEGGILSYIIPNNPAGFPFEPCCDAHDRCYDNCKDGGKLDCDVGFCACVSGKCKAYAGYVQTACQRAAHEYCYRVMYSQTADEQFRKAREKCRIGVCKPN